MLQDVYSVTEPYATRSLKALSCYPLSTSRSKGDLNLPRWHFLFNKHCRLFKSDFSFLNSGVRHCVMLVMVLCWIFKNALVLRST
jgi:hypothetical protein